MLVLDNKTKALLLENSLHREIVIRFPNATEGEISEIGSSNIIADSLELTHSICDEKEFVLGGCIVGQFSIQVIGIEQALNNKRINVFIKQTYSKGALYPSDDLFPSDDLLPGLQKGTVEIQIFSGTIDSSLRQKNRSVKEIIAYDDLFLMSKIKCYNWFLGYVKYTPNITLGGIARDVLDQFEIYTGISLAFNFSGFNNAKSLAVTTNLAENVAKDDMTLLDLLKAYAELNAIFIVISNTGKLKCVGLYKQLPTSNTTKKDVDEVIESYANLTFEEYITQPINRIRFRYNKNKNQDYGYSNKKQSWYVSDNLITSCCTDVLDIVTAFNDGNGNNYIFGDLYSYRPFTADVFARWWLEPGDKIQIKTGYNDTETVESFIFERTIKGINGMRVTLKTKGIDFLGKDDIESEV